ncbi:MAG: hypothetical protein IJL53_08420 [Firmicutes bacterium]|nr:hypothetical protein [Bacillota bacterium]
MTQGIQLEITPAAGKQLIAKGLLSRADVQDALENHIVVIISGTTNAEIAAEILARQDILFQKRGFYRGIVKPAEPVPTFPPVPPVPARAEDIVLVRGEWKEGQTIYDIASSLGSKDIIFKGANAVHPESRTAGILIGNPQTGTIGPCQAAAVGRRTTLIHPVGLEKRVDRPVYELAQLVNDPSVNGPHLYPTVGIPYTELDAIEDLCGIRPVLIAAGGVAGYEGVVRLLCKGDEEQLAKVKDLYLSVKDAPNYIL